MCTHLKVAFVTIFTICHCQQYFKWSSSHKYVWVGPDPSTTWTDDETFCNNIFGTNLASVHSPADQTELKALCDNSGVNTNYCLIGLTDQISEGTFVWTDGTPYDYSNWDVNSNTNPAEDCVIVYSGGLWHDTSCTGPQADGNYVPFVCNAPLENLSIWSENNSYIWVGPAQTDFYTANTFCTTQFGTELASIHSQEENIELANVCNKWSGTHCFIGLNDITTEGTYEWIDGTAVDYGPVWSPGEPDNSPHTPEGEDCVLLFYGGSNWGDSPCDFSQYPYSFICNAPKSCEISNPGSIAHIDWDVIVNNVNDNQTLYHNVSVKVDTMQLNVEINVDLEYLGYSYADNGIGAFGSTYFITLNSFSANTLDIFSDNGLNECDNRLAPSFTDVSWENKWKYSETPYIDGHVGTDKYLAYPPPGDYWTLTAAAPDNSNRCDRINYFGSFSWSDLQNICENPQTNESSVDILIDNDWINLTGTFHINIISPLYKDIDSSMYRIYELVNQHFTISVSKSVHILGSTGISLYKATIIAINADDSLFKMDIITETADYLQLSSPSLLIAPSGYNLNIDPLNANCLSYKSNICVQSWQISAVHNKTCNDFTGVYAIQWIAQCNPNITNNTRCLSYTGDLVTLDVETDYQDTTCDSEGGKVQFDAEMTFYKNDSYSVDVRNDYSFVVGKDTIYVEIELNNPVQIYSIFDVKLINVWLCTIDDEVYGSMFSVSQTDPLNTGCFSTIIDNDAYNPYWIIQNYDESFEYDAQHIIDASNNILRFSFQTPYTLTRDTLWVHAQIELSLNENNRRLIDANTKTTSSIGQIRHFVSSVNVETDAVIEDTILHPVTTQQETDSAILTSSNFVFWLLMHSVLILVF